MRSITRQTDMVASLWVQVFISYRHDDSKSVVGRIRDRLQAQGFRVFRDRVSITSGDQLSTAIINGIASSDVVIAAVGPRWTRILRDNHRNGEYDWVRYELRLALQSGKPIVPVLVSGAEQPRMRQIRRFRELHPLLDILCHVVRDDPDFDHDMQQLADVLVEKKERQRNFPQPPPPQPAPTRGEDIVLTIIDAVGLAARSIRKGHILVAGILVALVTGTALALPAAELVRDLFPRLWLRGPILVEVPGGSFWTGEKDGSGACDEEPIYVSVSAFQMDETEVTVAHYRTCVSTGACSVPGNGDGCNWDHPRRNNHPVNCVTWNQASSFCDWSGKRLPTEQEWEYAARGEDERKYPWGDAPPTPGVLCWERSTTCPVGARPRGKSPFGLHDMAGNVWELTATRYRQSHARCTVKHELDWRVVRGGAFDTEGAWLVRSSYRTWTGQSDRDPTHGFRCAK